MLFIKQTIIVQRTFQITGHCSVPTNSIAELFVSLMYRIPNTVFIVIIISEASVSISSTRMIPSYRFAAALKSCIPSIPRELDICSQSLQRFPQLTNILSNSNQRLCRIPELFTITGMCQHIPWVRTRIGRRTGYNSIRIFRRESIGTSHKSIRPDTFIIISIARAK